ncbi:MAG: PAS domain S-box protein [Anaeromyxobacter sp.]|nr:PAS domain S-box protein [Anaeromyxobacter sp.]MBL0274750.1 PAS domain S-box protein [Anaeromyxobacter sp.]
MRPLSTSPQGDLPERARPHWLWYAPRVSIALFVVAFLGLLWVKHRQEAEEARDALIRDILWVEQSIRFSLDREVEQLQALDRGLGGRALDQAALDLLVSHLLPSTPGLTQVVVLDEQGRVVAGAPQSVEVGRPWVFEGAERDARETAYRLALGTGKAAWGPPFDAGDLHRFEVYVPRSRGGVRAGAVVGVHAIDGILAGLVPWWLAEKHRVTVRDASGAIVAAKSNVEAGGPEERTHQVPLEPPGQGLVLHLASYPTETQVLPSLITAALVGLAGAMLWNLWALRRHIQRRLATEQALRAEHGFRKAMEDSLHTGMRAVDLTGRVVYVNPAFCRMVGYQAGELIGEGGATRPYWPPEEQARIVEALEAARAGGASPTGIELRLMRRDGERFDALLYEAPLIDADGRQTGWMGSVLDITERKQARERTRQQEEKLAATARLITMGEMASALAHELNQPLAAIAGYTAGSLNLLRAGGPASAGVEEALRKTAQQAQRAGQIIRRVHEFVRQREPTRTAVRINSTVEEALGFAEAEARTRQVRIAVRLADDDPVLQADPVLLQQVLLNLLRNGMDAMAATPPAERRLEVTVARAEASVTVVVADRGCGLTPQVRDQMFQPFFTTKAGGMGMGLHICRSIMETHGGRVWAEANPAGGAVVAFSLPVEPA